MKRPWEASIRLDRIARQPGHHRRWVLATVSVPIVIVLAIELAARLLGFQGAPVVQQHPYLGFGQTGLESDIARTEGPAALGYRSYRGAYRYDISLPITSSVERGRVLFRGQGAPALDPRSEPLRVFILGGSTAAGAGASSPDAEWWLLLERGLTAELERSVDVINASAPGYVTTQERVTLDSVLAARPDAVLILNGLNDVAV